MPDYHVVWEIDIFAASSPEDAAKQALEIQRDKYSIAKVFAVIEHDAKEYRPVMVDLDERPEVVVGGYRRQSRRRRLNGK